MTSSISRTCSTSPSESGALNSRHSSVVVAATPRTSSMAPTKSMLALTTTVSTASTTASRSTTTTTATHERRGFRSNAKKKALPAIAALGIFFLLLLSFEVLDRCLFYNDYYLRDYDSGIGNHGGNHGNGSPPMPPRADQSLVKRHLRSMAFLLWNASEHPPLAAVRRDGKGGNNLDGDGDGNGSRSLSDNNYVGNDDETKDGLSHGDIHDMSDNDNTRNTNFSSNGRTSHLQVLTQEAQRSNRKPMSDIHSDDLESWAEVEGKSEKQWPPREIMDGLVDEMKRVVVIAVNCGFLDMADNYLNSVVQQGVENYVVVPLDSVAHRVMSEAYPGHVLPMPPELQTHQTPTVLTTSAYNTENFRILTSLRPSILLRFLRGGYSPFYNDVDMVWKANLFTTLMEIHHSNKAFLVRGKGGTYGDGANTSTIFMRPTEENIRFVLAWKEEMEMMDANGEKMKHANDQFGFNAVLNGREAGRDLPRIFGDSERFPSFKDYFWEGGGKEEKKEAEKKRKKALLVHNNGLKTKEDKIKRFQKFGLWELSGRLGEYQCEDVVAVGADAFAGGIEKSTS